MEFDGAIRGEHGGAREAAGRKKIATELPPHDPKTREIRNDNAKLDFISRREKVAYAAEPKAYALAQITLFDPAAYSASGYPAMVEAAVAAYGGRYVVRGGSPEALEGTASGDWTVI
ncbi:DUF1330 domain-containing protein [Acidisoma cellulosilytica]|uniref:DUF1330 domain-containing protein n=1 Tax=Acidisoma cellulosilyticum TaxID=2802395 RepID=A0A963Z6X1_9PROT|nr:DUF1330 domain-containing protein [Acidisoma cellulosilyticum]MCB8883723.1 DUF1330 domain-containing protein [Acidisoma cellulosilyticum]